MKIIALLIITLLATLNNASAQGDQILKEASNPSSKDTIIMMSAKDYERSLRRQKIELQHSELLSTRHQFRVGIGGSARNSPTSRYNNFLQSPAFNIEYSYRLVDFLELGAFIAYSHLTESLPIYLTDFQTIPSTYQDVMSNYFSGGIFLRYGWFNRRWVSLYSSLGASYSLDLYNSNSQQRADVDTQVRVEWVPFGIRIGKGRFFGYFEPLAISQRGNYLNLGIGYKF